MHDSFHKFPHTPHLLWLGPGQPREDKVLSPSEVADFLTGELVIEEKVDGANLGLSLGPDERLRAQSRGHYLAPGRCHAQWNPLWAWLAERRAELEAALASGLTLYGEWCHARHTVPYNALPDWFLAFDVYETPTERFWSVDRRNAWLTALDLFPVPEVRRGCFRVAQLPALLGRSALGDVSMEGIYLRRQQGDQLVGRAKIVSNAFKQQIEAHWARRPVVSNRLATNRFGGVAGIGAAGVVAPAND